MIKLGKSFWWVIVLTAVSLFVTFVPQLSGNPIYIRLTLVLGLVVLFSGLWAGASLRGVELRRSTRTSRKQVGEIFTENYEISNHSVLPKVWLKVTDSAGLPGGTGSRVLTWLGSRQNRSYVAYTLLQERGWFYLGPTTIESGDVFGLFLKARAYEAQSRLLVVPYTVPIHEFPAPFGILSGGRALRQKTLEMTSYAAGVREYVPGDPLRRIHWPTSARKQKLMVKEFEKDPLAEVWIFLDASRSARIHKTEITQQSLNDVFWAKEKRAFHLPPYAEEYAISVAASIGQYYINEKREVGLVAAGQNDAIFPPERGERQLGKLLETLAVLQPEGELPIWGLVSSQINHLARGSTIVLITPTTDENIFSVTLDLGQRGLMPVVVLIDPVSFGGEGDAGSIRTRLLSYGIFTFLVREGEDIKAALSSPPVTYRDGKI